jgi:hypothetical protein
MGPNNNELKEWAKTQKSISEQGLRAYFEMSESETEDVIKFLQIMHVISIFREDGAFKVIPAERRLAEVCSLDDLDERLNHDMEKTAVISFSDYPWEKADIPSSIPSFQLSLMDFEYEQIHQDAEKWFFEAKAMASFIYGWYKKGYRFICQCVVGVSRSAAVAAAILERYEGKGIDIFSDFRYHPNKMIYLTLLKDLREKGI